MPNIRVEYGPPGEKGVSHIMGIGADELAELDATENMLQKATWFGLGVWLIGLATNKPTVRGIGIGAVAVGFGARHLSK